MNDHLGYDFMGIDPGINGAIAQLGNDFVKIHKMPRLPDGELDFQALFDIFLMAKNDGVRKCVLEKVNAMPKQGVASSFTFGTRFGATYALAVAAGLPVELVAPVKWQNVMHAGFEGKPKARSVAAAQKLFPHIDLKATKRSRKPDDNICDALLMAGYAQGRKP